MKLQVSKLSVANAHRILQHGLEYRLQFAGRRTDDAQYFGGRRLLFQRLGEVGRPLAQSAQQPRVLDGDHGLRVSSGTVTRLRTRVSLTKRRSCGLLRDAATDAMSATWMSRFVFATRASTVVPVMGASGWRLLNSTNAGGALCIATARQKSPSARYSVPKLARQRRVALSRMTAKTRCKSSGDALIRRSTSAAAACCCKASFNSRLLRSSCSCRPAAAARGCNSDFATAERLRPATCRRRECAALPPALPRRFIGFTTA